MNTTPRIREGSNRPKQTQEGAKLRPNKPQPVKRPAPVEAADPNIKRAPLADRITDMTDSDLVRLQSNAMRISAAPGHPKKAAADSALPSIEAEIGRRATALAERSKVAAEARAVAAKAQKDARAAAKRAAKV